MNLASIRPGDTVKINKRGRRFLAVVVEKEKGVLRIQPQTRNINYFTAKAREVVERYPRRT